MCFLNKNVREFDERWMDRSGRLKSGGGDKHQNIEFLLMQLDKGHTQARLRKYHALGSQDLD